jgi:hypothetical protein
MVLLDPKRLTDPVRRLFTADDPPAIYPPVITAAAAANAAALAALTAAASAVKKPQSSFLQHTQEWQAESWGFYDSLAEVNSGIWWLANMLSRVRLKAAELHSDGDEPTIVTEKTLATEIMDRLSGGVGGQAQLMRNLTIQLSAPGDCYMIGEGTAAAESWTVRSIDEVRAQNQTFQVVSERVPTLVWSDLPDEGQPVRIWRPHPRFYHLADSNMRAALPVARELDLVNRHIMAQYLSRLASAGLLVLPTEATFPVREEFQDAEDPLMTEFIEISAEAIRTPGTAAGVVPIFIKVPKEVADVIRHVDFTLKIDEKIIEKRDSAIRRLASKLDVPTEVITGMGDVNHWTAWQLDEGALKTHIAPMAEIICDSLTRGYLKPRMEASGATAEEISTAVVWYDMSELAMRPDKSANAKTTYDVIELSGAALRREGGFSEDDAPTSEEIRVQGLKLIIRQSTDPATVIAALNELTGKEVLAVPTAAPAVTGGTPADEEPSPEETSEPGPPNEGEPPAGPGEARISASAAEGIKDARALLAQTTEAATQRAMIVAGQASALHLIRFNKTRRSLSIMHPQEPCHDHAWSCPFTHATWERPPASLSTGIYECRLSASGDRLSVGASAPEMDNGKWITVERKLPPVRRPVNGRAH